MNNKKNLVIGASLALALSFGLAQTEAGEKAAIDLKAIELYETSAFSAVSDKVDIKSWELYATSSFSKPEVKQDLTGWERYMTSGYAAVSKKGGLFR